MHQILFLIFFSIFNPLAASESKFSCKKSLVNYFSLINYALVVDSADTLDQIKVKHSSFLELIKKSETLTEFNFELVIATNHSKYFLIDNRCISKKKAYSNLYPLKKYYNLSSDVVEIKSDKFFSRVFHGFNIARKPSSSDLPLFLIKKAY